jgi:hypothetical protein
MANTHKTLIAAVCLTVLVGATRAEGTYTELPGAPLPGGVVDALASDEPQALPGIAPRNLSFHDMISHSNNTRFVLDDYGVVLEPLGAMRNPDLDLKRLIDEAPLTLSPSSVVAIPAPGALWLLALGTMSTLRRRRD